MRKFENVLICSDFDGTFYSGNPDAVEKNVNAIEYFKRNGGLFTFATGRDLFSFDSKCRNASKIVNAPVIIANGARLYDYKFKQFLVNIPLKLDAFIPLIRRLHAVCPEAGIRMSFEDAFVLPCHNELIRTEFGDRSYEKHIKIMPFDKLEQDKPVIYKAVLIYRSGEIEQLKQFLELADSSGNFKFSQSYATGLEVINSSTDKGKMLLKIKDFVAGCRTTYAIGDYLNDIEMLSAADNSASPENALPQVKAISALHTVHCENGAIADLISQIERNL